MAQVVQADFVPAPAYLLQPELITPLPLAAAATELQQALLLPEAAVLIQFSLRLLLLVAVEVVGSHFQIQLLEMVLMAAPVVAVDMVCRQIPTGLAVQETLLVHLHHKVIMAELDLLMPPALMVLEAVAVVRAAQDQMRLLVALPETAEREPHLPFLVRL